MTVTSTLGFSEAAQVLGVSIRKLRSAIRAGKLAAPAGGISAVTPLSAEWVENAKQTAKTSGDVFKHTAPAKVPAFARYDGTSAWRKYAVRVRDFNHFRAASK